MREAHSHFSIYKRYIWRRYKAAAHINLLDISLMRVARYIESGGTEGIARLVVMMPPRHGKTASISRLFPTWFLGRNPDSRVIMASYGATLAEKNSRYARNVLAMPKYQAVFPSVTLSKDSAARDAWDLAGHDGGLDAVGVGSGVTGKGGNLIVVDDPVKSREEAESPVYRDKVWDWYTDDLYTRLEPHGALIVVQTRWHEDDLSGRLLKTQGDKWTVLSLPAISDQGAALWPERFPLAVLEDIRGTLGEYAWSALYQQRPVPAEGGLFKRANFNIITTIPECTQRVRFWDLAMSEKTSADYSVGTLMGMGADGRIKVLDVVRRQVEWDQLASLMADTALRDGPNVVIGFEQQGYMSRAGQALAQDPRLHLFSIFGYPKDKDKLTNALPFAARVGLQVVDVVEAHWTADWLDELCSFPRGAHDDQVDASAGAYEMLSSGVFDAGAMNYAEEYGIDSAY